MRKHLTWDQLTVTDICNGWSVRIRRKDGTTFVAFEKPPIDRAFFSTHREARRLVRELREHNMQGRVVRARMILETEP